MTENEESVFTAGAANTVAHGTCWIRSSDNVDQGYVCYALHNCVAIASVERKEILCSLKGHTGKINAITHCTDKNNTTYLISSSDDGIVIVWKHMHSDNIRNWGLLQMLDPLNSATVALHCMCTNNNITIVASDGSGNIKIWIGNESFLQVLTWKVPPSQLPHSIHLCSLDESGINILLSVGSVDSRIHLYVIETISGGYDARAVGTLSGHEEWITCLSSNIRSNGDIFLASGSQDTKIRVWKVVKCSTETLRQSFDELAEDDAEEEVDETEEGKEITTHQFDDDISSEARLQFAVKSGSDTVTYRVFLESLLVGHEDWVTSVHWMSSSSRPRLFSSSMDRNMVIWSPDELDAGSSTYGVWNPIIRVGDIGGSLGGSVGGNLLGFVDGCVSPAANAILGIGFGGSFHLWQCRLSSGSSAGAEEERWFPVPFMTGHFESVNDIAWSAQGECLFSASSDQTCRIFAPLKTDGEAVCRWKEISRPQIHGYNLNCVVPLPFDNTVIITAGDEKVLRAFEMPSIVARGLKQLGDIELVGGSAHASRVEQAYIPELGLSNKAKETMSKQELDEQEARSVALIDWKAVPLESQLTDYTLWPETKKLFGHSNDVVCMVISRCGQWIASSCKARDAAAARIIVWSVKGNELVSRLAGHESTVVCMQFSPDGRYLVSSGKDRTLCLFAMSASNQFELCFQLKNAHKRIVWDCRWDSSNNGLVYSVSRDGVCKVWRLIQSQFPEGDSIQLQNLLTFTPFEGSVSVTALDTFHCGAGSFLIFGSEGGDVSVWKYDEGSNAARTVHTVKAMHSHGSTVRKIRVRPNSIKEGEAGGSKVLVDFATCSEDNSIRVHRVSLSASGEEVSKQQL